MPETETPASDATSDAGATPAGSEDTGTENGATPELGESGRKALDDERKRSRELERRAKEAEGRLAEIENAGKSELERITAERDSLKERVAELERGESERDRNDRARSAATAAGIPDLWDRLKGDTDDELAKDAKAVAERFGVSPSSRDLGAGARPAARSKEGMNDRIRRSRGR